MIECFIGEDNPQGNHRESPSAHYLAGIASFPGDTQLTDTIASTPNTRDESGKERPPTVLLINAGLLHHVGPYRLYTQLARNLADLGFTCLRFDLTGLGDSSYPSNDSEHQHQAQRDISSAMDFMQREYHSRKFILCGLCSGADDAMIKAQHDPRVSAIALLDGLAFRTPGFYLHHWLVHYPSRLVSAQKWRVIGSRYKCILRAKLDSTGLTGNRHPAAANETDTGASLIPDERQLPDRKDFTNTLEILAKKGVATLFLYTGGVSHYFNHYRQFGAMCGKQSSQKLFTFHYLPQADHLLLQPQHREKVLDLVCHWAQSLPLEDSRNCGDPSTSDNPGAQQAA